MKKPCLTCTRVKDPSKCQNKYCQDWRDWFTESWNEIRSRFGYRKES